MVAGLRDDATTSLSRAKSDDAVFTKAEADLTPPKTAAETGAVDEANKHMRSGEPDKAKDVFKVASVDADYVATVGPLAQTSQDVQKASGMMSDHKYYAANQQLRAAQIAVRCDNNVQRRSSRDQPKLSKNEGLIAGVSARQADALND